MVANGGSPPKSPRFWTNQSPPSSDCVKLTGAIQEDTSSFTFSNKTYTMTSSNEINVFIAFVFVLELLVLIFVAVLEYFLRETDVFPLRLVNFTCTDPTISYSPDDGDQTYEDFAYNADVAYEVIVGLCFAVAPFIIVVSEIALWAFSDDRQKTVLVICAFCKVPQVIRRILRFTGAFLFGLLVTMIFTDVAKLFVGRLRPTFLDTCRPNVTLCREVFVDNSVCLETDADILREARMSFPSLHASMTAYSTFFIAIYLHHTIRSPGVRILRPFVALCFVLLTFMGGLARLGRHYSHWSDVLVGWLLGFFIAAYVCISAMNCFREHLSVNQFYSSLKSFFLNQRLMEFRDLYKENWDRMDHEFAANAFAYPNLGYTTTYPAPLATPRTPAHSNDWHNGSPTLLIPRPHVNQDIVGEDIGDYGSPPLPPRSPNMRGNNKRNSQTHNTFQREINRAVEPYRATYRDYQERHRQPINHIHM